MATELEHDCPGCSETEIFYRAASTKIHLGEKKKWKCTECGYGFIEIDGIDSSKTTLA